MALYVQSLLCLALSNILIPLDLASLFVCIYVSIHPYTALQGRELFWVHLLDSFQKLAKSLTLVHTETMVKIQLNWICYIDRSLSVKLKSLKADESRACYTERNKSEREKQILYIDAYTWNLEKWYWWTYLQGRNRDADVENGLAATVGEGEGNTDACIHTTTWTPESQWEAAAQDRELSLMLCDNLGGGEGGSRGKMYVYIIMTNSRCTTETNTVKQLSSN